MRITAWFVISQCFQGWGVSKQGSMHVFNPALWEIHTYTQKDYKRHYQNVTMLCNRWLLCCIWNHEFWHCVKTASVFDTCEGEMFEVLVGEDKMLTLSHCLRSARVKRVLIMLIMQRCWVLKFDWSKHSITAALTAVWLQITDLHKCPCSATL